MAQYGTYKVHPVADLFPLIEGDEFAQLVADIKENGLIEPIVLASDDTTIVDGRNRYRACSEAEVDPRFIRLGKHYSEYDLIVYIFSRNIHRRHLDSGQRVMLGLEVEPKLAEAAKQRQRLSEGRGKKGPPISGEVNRRTGEVDHQIAAMVNVSHSTVSQGKKVKDASPRLADQVRAGKISLNDAYKQVRKKPGGGKGTSGKKGGTMLELKTHLGDVVKYKLPQGKATFNKTNEHVSWARFTWNPVTGCLHGCKYCYARELAVRESYKQAYPVGFTPLFHHERLDAPRNTVMPKAANSDGSWRRVFVCSMADLYGKWVPKEWIDAVHKSCIANPQWEYLMLTKFPRRYLEFDLPETAWIGTSVDEQKRVRLAEEAFRQIKGVRVKWLSLEPLLAPLEFSDLSMFDWVVMGSQTATEQPDGHVPEFAPPFEWVANITAQAKKAGCKVWQKPNLLGKTDPQAPGMKLIQEVPLFVNGKDIRAAQGELRV